MEFVRRYGQCFGLAASFTFLESLLRHRGNAWLSYTTSDWGAVAVVFIVYAGLSYALCYAISAVFRRRGRPHWFDTFLTGACIWTVLWSYSPQTKAIDVAAMYAVLLGVSLLPYLSPRRFTDRGVSAATIWTVSCFAGIGTLASATRWYFLATTRADIITELALAAVAVIALAGFLALRTSRPVLTSVLVLGLLAPAPMAFEAGLRWTRSSQHASGQNNLLLITCDALRADRCSVYGGTAPTPALEKLAATGVLFDRHYSLAPWTIPSVCALFTSSYPPALDPRDSVKDREEETYSFWGNPVAETFAERLRSRGYRTAAIIGHLGLSDRSTNVLRGFDAVRCFPHINVEHAGYFRSTPLFNACIATVCPDWAPLRPIDTGALLSQSARWFLDDQATSPFFLWVHLMNPHSPYDPPDPYRTVTGPWPVFAPELPELGSPAKDENDDIDMDEAYQPYVRSLYDGCIRYADESVGVITDELRTQEFAAQTVICVTADHGEELWERGRIWHGQSLYDELIRVPLLIAGPGIPVQRVAQNVSAIDVIPTLADLLHVEPIPDWRGVSWGDALRVGAEPTNASPTYAQCIFFQHAPMRAVVNWPWKLVAEAPPGPVHLYNLSSDSAELLDRSAESPEVVKTLTETLDQWSSTLLPNAAPAPGDDAQSSRDALRQQLQSMGYLK